MTAGAGANEGSAPVPRTLTNSLKLLLATGLYVAALLWAYAAIVSPAFAYDGCNLTWPGTGAMVWLVTLALLPASFLPYSLKRPSALIVWWLYLAVYIPSILVPALSLSMPFEELFLFHITLLPCMGLLCLISSVRLLAIRQIAISRTLFWWGFLLVWVMCLGYVATKVRPSMLVTNLASLFQGANPYTIRSSYRDLILETGPGLAYVVGQLGQALNPFLMAFGLVYRRRMCLVAGIIGQVIVFSLTGFRAALGSVLFLAIVALLMRYWRRSFGLALTSGLIAAILISAIADHASQRVLFSSIITRRTLVTPGLLSGFYFEHYSHFEPVGIGFHFSRGEDFVGPANEIGLAYFRSLDVNANANLWAEGFAELGLPGILGFTLLVAFLIWIYDSIAIQRDPTLAALLAAMPAVTLSNTSPTTTLVSHGGLAVALVLYLTPSPNSDEILEPEMEPEESHRIPSTA